MKDLKKYTGMNQAMWDEAHAYHIEGRMKKNLNLLEEVKSPEFCDIHPQSIADFEKINFSGKDLLHLSCNNGIELITMIKKGARYGVGYDISQKFIDEAKSYAKAGNVNCQFFQSDVFDLTPEKTGTFDIAFTTVGAFCWYPDISLFFDKIAPLIKSGGYFYCLEIHPMINLLQWPDNEGFDPNHPLNVEYSYFRKDPIESNDGCDYIGGVKYEAKPSVEFIYRIDIIINSLLRNGFEICEFHENDFDVGCFHEPAKNLKKLPLSFTIIARKK